MSQKRTPKPSIRRNPGDWVYLQDNTGFVGESDRLRAQIPPDEDPDAWSSCMLSCGDPECREWPNLQTEPDPENDGECWLLCHVSECQMWTYKAPPRVTIPRWREIQKARGLESWWRSRGGDSPKAIRRRELRFKEYTAKMLAEQAARKAGPDLTLAREALGGAAVENILDAANRVNNSQIRIKTEGAQDGSSLS